jgi:hypothetical protein
LDSPDPHPSDEELAVYLDRLLIGEEPRVLAASPIGNHVGYCRECFDLLVTLENAHALESLEATTLPLRISLRLQGTGVQIIDSLGRVLKVPFIPQPPRLPEGAFASRLFDLSPERPEPHTETVSGRTVLGNYDLFVSVKLEGSKAALVLTLAPRTEPREKAGILIRILDEHEKVIVQGKTDERGKTVLAPLDAGTFTLEILI